MVREIPLPFDNLSFSSIIGLPLDWLTFSNASTISKSYSPLGHSLLSAISFSVLGWKFIVILFSSSLHLHSTAGPEQQPCLQLPRFRGPGHRHLFHTLRTARRKRRDG